MFGKSKRYRVEPLLDEERFAEPEKLARITGREKVQGSTVAHQETLVPEAVSSISSNNVNGQGNGASDGLNPSQTQAPDIDNLA